MSFKTIKLSPITSLIIMDEPGWLGDILEDLSESLLNKCTPSLVIGDIEKGNVVYYKNYITEKWDIKDPRESIKTVLDKNNLDTNNSYIIFCRNGYNEQ